MSENRYDVIVVGARCAGSPTAMLLARRATGSWSWTGRRSPATPSPPTSSIRRAWPRCGAGACSTGSSRPAAHRSTPTRSTSARSPSPVPPGTADSPVAYSPRRTVLDKLLVDAAAEAGAEVREGFTVSDVIVEDGRVTGVRGHSKGGATVTERARVVIGADGVHSVVARTVRPDQYHDKPRLQCSYYTYYSGLPMDGRFEVYLRPPRAFAVWPTNDDLTLVIGGWPYAEFEANRTDIEGNYLQEFRARAGVRRTAPRQPSARRVRRRGRAELLPQALRSGLGAGRRCRLQQGLHHRPGHHRRLPGRRAVRHRPGRGVLRRPILRRGRWRDYQATRDDQVLPIYEFTAQLAILEPPPPELQQLLGAVARQPGRDGRFRAGQRRGDVTGRVLLRRERRSHPRNPGATGELREGRARRSS